MEREKRNRKKKKNQLVIPHVVCSYCVKQHTVYCNPKPITILKGWLCQYYYRDLVPSHWNNCLFLGDWISANVSSTGILWDKDKHAQHTARQEHIRSISETLYIKTEKWACYSTLQEVQTPTIPARRKQHKT